MRDPARELPRAMFQALGIVMVLVNAVIVMTLTLPTTRATCSQTRVSRCSAASASS